MVAKSMSLLAAHKEWLPEQDHKKPTYILVREVNIFLLSRKHVMNTVYERYVKRLSNRAIKQLAEGLISYHRIIYYRDDPDNAADLLWILLRRLK